MKNIFYNIHHFEWDKEANTFTADSDKLYVMDEIHFYKIPFPNQRTKFYIKNPNTNGFRRFYYKKELPLNSTEVIWVFESEDGINCEIKTKKE